jgi:hypothetical protein
MEQKEIMVVLEISKAAIGPFIGAGLAFFSNWLVRQSQKENENAAAGNLAIVTLGLMINSYAVYRNKVKSGFDRMDTERPNDPLWTKMLPIHYEFDDELKFDLKALSFLFDVKTVEVMNDLLCAQLNFHNLVRLQISHFEAMTGLQAAVAKLHLEDARKVESIEIIRANLPAHLLARVEALNLAILEAFETQESELNVAYIELQKALCSVFGTHRIRKFVLNPELTVTDASHAAPQRVRPNQAAKGKHGC